MDNFDQDAQNNDYGNLENSSENIQRFMDARDYSDHSYDMQIESSSDQRDNRENIREFMDVEVDNQDSQKR